MRPINRGPAPAQYSKYQDAKEDLVARLGLFCTYCERPIKTNLAVEHVLPKALYPQHEVDWSNFVLGCVNCNSTKGARDVVRSEVILPDQDNSLRAFEYTSLGEVFVSRALGSGIQAKASATLELTGLDKFPTDFEHNDEVFQAALERWQQRSDAWKVAEIAASQLAAQDTAAVREIIVELAMATGFFSVWMRVFGNDADMRRRFISTFPGTAKDCFDSDGRPVLRTGGHC